MAVSDECYRVVREIFGMYPCEVVSYPNGATSSVVMCDIGYLGSNIRIESSAPDADSDVSGFVEVRGECGGVCMILSLEDPRTLNLLNHVLFAGINARSRVADGLINEIGMVSSDEGA